MKNSISLLAFCGIAFVTSLYAQDQSGGDIKENSESMSSPLMMLRVGEKKSELTTNSNNNSSLQDRTAVARRCGDVQRANNNSADSNIIEREGEEINTTDEGIEIKRTQIATIRRILEQEKECVSTLSILTLERFTEWREQFEETLVYWQGEKERYSQLATQLTKDRNTRATGTKLHEVVDECDDVLTHVNELREQLEKLDPTQQSSENFPVPGRVKELQKKFEKLDPISQSIETLSSGKTAVTSSTSAKPPVPPNLLTKVGADMRQNIKTTATLQVATELLEKNRNAQQEFNKRREEEKNLLSDYDTLSEAGELFETQSVLSDVNSLWLTNMAYKNAQLKAAGMFNSPIQKSTGSEFRETLRAQTVLEEADKAHLEAKLMTTEEKKMTLEELENKYTLVAKKFQLVQFACQEAIKKLQTVQPPATSILKKLQGDIKESQFWHAFWGAHQLRIAATRAEKEAHTLALVNEDKSRTLKLAWENVATAFNHLIPQAGALGIEYEQEDLKKHLATVENQKCTWNKKVSEFEHQKAMQAVELAKVIAEKVQLAKIKKEQAVLDLKKAQEKVKINAGDVARSWNLVYGIFQDASEIYSKAIKAYENGKQELATSYMSIAEQYIQAAEFMKQAAQTYAASNNKEGDSWFNTGLFIKESAKTNVKAIEAHENRKEELAKSYMAVVGQYTQAAELMKQAAQAYDAANKAKEKYYNDPNTRKGKCWYHAGDSAKASADTKIKAIEARENRKEKLADSYMVVANEYTSAVECSKSALQYYSSGGSENNCKGGACEAAGISSSLCADTKLKAIEARENGRSDQASIYEQAAEKYKNATSQYIQEHNANDIMEGIRLRNAGIRLQKEADNMVKNVKEI